MTYRIFLVLYMSQYWLNMAQLVDVSETLHPDVTAPWHQFRMLYEDQRNLNLAESMYKNRNDSYIPSIVPSLSNLGHLYIGQGDSEESLDVFFHVCNILPIFCVETSYSHLILMVAVIFFGNRSLWPIEKSVFDCSWNMLNTGNS